ncbi:MAG: dissimilatory sulfite reductase-asociated protein DsvD [Desulfobacteraceae bacterium 4572_89]|nr:MAG: dissimilatory sulfite reductase-asociated protein DsvD [Desulfobacteraceae bacterium 4572_89]
MSDLLDNKEAATKAVVDYMTKKSKTKTKFYFKDFSKVFPDDKLRAIKKVVNALVVDEVLEYWSSGSTTMYGLKGSGKQHSSEGEE